MVEKKTKNILMSLYKSKSSPIEGMAEVRRLPPVSSPSPSVNLAIGGGIIPGLTYCFEGPKSGGKSMFAYACVAEMCRKEPDGKVFWFDSEFSFTEHWCKVFGISVFDPNENPDGQMVIIPTNNPLNIFDYFYNDLMDAVENEGLKILACVVDSLQCIMPPRESNRENSTAAQYAPLALYLPGAFRLVAEPSRKHNIPWIFISQVRQNMDPKAKYTAEGKYSTGGGEAFKHLVDVEIRLEMVEGKKAKIFDEEVQNINDTAVAIGHRIRIKVMKNKVCSPFRVAEFDLNYKKGIVNQSEEIARMGVNHNIITKDGNTYFFNDQKLAVGLPKTLEVIGSSEAIQNEIMKHIIDKENKDDSSDNCRRPTSEDE